MRIIVNADDMGLSGKVNQTILMMYRMGIVSSTTVMAFSSKFEDAVMLLRENPGLAAGVHLCLDGPFSSGEVYRTIKDPLTGHFFDNLEVIRRLKQGLLDRDEIFREYCLQIERILDRDIPVSHLDHHHHLHLYFPVLNMVIRAARKYHIPFVRSQRLMTCLPKSLPNILYREFHQLFLKSRLRTVRAYYDPAMADCPGFDENLVRMKRLFRRKRGVVDIMLHPRDPDDPETRFFTHPEVRELLGHQEIISYYQLTGRPHPR